jgi:hypothetical protein
MLLPSLHMVLSLNFVISSTPSLSDNFLATNPNTSDYECSASPFWKLLLLFEALIFQPESSLKALGHNVIRRLKLLANGTLRNYVLK